MRLITESQLGAHALKLFQVRAFQPNVETDVEANGFDLTAQGHKSLAESITDWFSDWSTPSETTSMNHESNPVPVSNPSIQPKTMNDESNPHESNVQTKNANVWPKAQNRPSNHGPVSMNHESKSNAHPKAQQKLPVAIPDDDDLLHPHLPNYASDDNLQASTHGMLPFSMRRTSRTALKPSLDAHLDRTWKKSSSARPAQVQDQIAARVLKNKRSVHFMQHVEEKFP